MDAARQCRLKGCSRAGPLFAHAMAYGFATLCPLHRLPRHRAKHSAGQAMRLADPMLKGLKA